MGSARDMTLGRFHIGALLRMAGTCALLFAARSRTPADAMPDTMSNTMKTVADRVNQYGATAHARLAPDFARAGVPYPPASVMLAGFKAERVLQVWASDTNGAWRHIRDYPILGASGGPGPKLREGDGQVPEGLYRVESLNPNSLHHLALRVSYPSREDRLRAAEDGRTQLGGDIMIHGGTASSGCLAMGDEAAEDLFVLAAETGIANVAIVVSPVDFRVRELPADMPPVPPWTAARYALIRAQLARLGASGP